MNRSRGRAAGRRVGLGRARRGGFSLLEVLVVIAILGLLAALVAPRVLNQVGRSRVKTTQSQMVLLEGAVQQFRLDMGRPPTAEEGLEALLARPQGPGADKWQGPYLERDNLPKDGWDREFLYEYDEGGRFVIRSLGADGREGGEGENADLSHRD